MHQFLKLGAIPITTPLDILTALNIETSTPHEVETPLFTEHELAILSLLVEPRDSDTIIRSLDCAPQETLTLLMHMELKGYIREQNGLFLKV